MGLTRTCTSKKILGILSFHLLMNRSLNLDRVFIQIPITIATMGIIAKLHCLCDRIGGLVSTGANCTTSKIFRQFENILTSGRYVRQPLGGFFHFLKKYTFQRNKLQKIQSQKYFDKRKVCAAAIRGISFSLLHRSRRDNKQANQGRRKRQHFQRREHTLCHTVEKSQTQPQVTP